MPLVCIFRPDVEQQPQVPQVAHAPAMMTFKQFLNAQDDNISDEEAFKKYQEYKLEFRKTQMSDFFQQHKEEEWYVVNIKSRGFPIPKGACGVKKLPRRLFILT